MGAIGYLLDTHTFLWAVFESSKLSAIAKETLTDNGSNCFVSAVSAYEIMNKHRLGKLPDYAYIAQNYLNILRQFGARELPIKTSHAYYAGMLDWEHRDPFDRLLAAQAFVENLTLITDDSIFRTLPELVIMW